MLTDSVATFASCTPAALACVDLETDRRWCYREFDQVINQAANWLVKEFGSASAERIATIAHNTADMLILNLACIRAGCIFVPCNWRLSPAEIAVILDDAQPAIIFTGAEFSSTEFSSPARSTKTFLLPDLLFASAGCSTQAPAGCRALSETSTLLYTSGTSGHPKGVMLSELNTLASQFAFGSGNGVSAKSVFLCDMPLFHTAGLLANTRAALMFGATVLISSGFDPDKTLARLADTALGITHYFSVPQMASRLWNHPQFDAEKLRRLQVYATGGAPNSKAQIERFINAGIPMLDGFGMTETGSVSGMPLGDPDVVISKAGSCGLLFVSLQARLVSASGDEVSPGEAGELCLRGPGVASGYWRQPEKTAEAFCEGWFKTGDIARFDDDGFLFIVDRKKDMIISGGENIYPVEVEQVIADMADVADVAVIGVADEQWGEQSVAFIVAEVGRVITGESVQTYCRSRLASYKVPKKIVLTDALPYSSTGKLQKQKLRDELAVNQ